MKWMKINKFKYSLIVPLFFICQAAISTSIYAQKCDCDISDRKVTAYDALLQLDDSEKSEAVATHLPWGIPENDSSATNEHLLHQTHYITNYDYDLRVPIWVAYRLRKQDVEIHRERTECFRKDIRILDSVAAFCEDYDEPIYDRGHLVPNADMTRSEAAMINTYMFTNMTPQHDKFNQVIWSRLEGYVRNWAKAKGEIYVITGSVFDKDDDGTRDDDSDANLMAPKDMVAVPTHFYKIILHERPNGYIESMVFLIPHIDKSIKGKAANPYLVQHLTSIDTIESLTGINFLPELGQSNPTKETAVEAFQATTMWPKE
jgi:endonuclease G